MKDLKKKPAQFNKKGARRRQAIKAGALSLLGMSSSIPFIASANTKVQLAIPKIHRFLTKIFTGVGSPEGNITAQPGSLFLRDDEGDGSVLWSKRSGAGSSGWADIVNLEIINVKDYGAVGDGLIDDTVALQTALRKGRTSKPVFIPAGTYRISEPLDMSFKRVFGVHHWRSTQGGTIIKVDEAASLNHAVFCANNPSQLENFIIDCNGSARYGLHTNKVHHATAIFRNVSVTGAIEAGFHFKQSVGAYFESLIAEKNLGQGFLIEGCNASTFLNLQSLRNGGVGVTILSLIVFINDEPKTTHTGGVNLLTGIVESNDGHSIVIRGTSTNCVVENFWIEAKNDIYPDGVVIEGAHLVQLRNCRISGCGDGTNRAIRLMGNSSDCIIDGNSAARSSGAANFAEIKIESGSLNNVITGNSRMAPNYGSLQVDNIDPQRIIY